MELRSIGTEFDYDFPPSQFSTETMVTRFRYRVVEHVETTKGTRERIEPIDMKRLYPVSMTQHRDGSYEVHETSETPALVTIKLA